MKHWIASVGLAASLATLPVYGGELLIGITGFDGTMTSDYTQTILGSKFAYSAENSQLGVGAYLGYVWNVNSGFNINFEGYYDYVDFTVSQSIVTEIEANAQPLTQKISGLGGLRVMPAFKITNNTELYLELGWADVDLTLTDANSNQSVSAWISGFRYGAGLQTKLYQNISLRAYYSVVDQMAKQTINSPLDGTISAQPTFTEFGVGVAYHFAV